MSTTIYPSSFLAFPFLSATNGVFRFWISQDETVDVSIADLTWASSSSIVLFESNSTIEVQLSSIDPDAYPTATATSDDFIIYVDNADGLTKKTTITDLIGSLSAAPTDATYVTLTSNATLTNESILAASTGLSLAGSTFSVDFTAVQAKDATLTSLALLGITADRIAYTTGSDTWAETTLTSFARTILSDTSASNMRGTLGLGTMATQSTTSFLSVANNLSDLASAVTARTNLGLGSLATQSGTFSGTSSGTNTGDQNLFSTISVSGQSDVIADSASDTLTLVAGTNITITTNAGSDSITINSSGGSGGLADGDYGDIVVSGTGTVMTIDSSVVGTSKLGGDITAAGKALLDDASASAQRTTLGLGTLATQSGTFSGTSSGTNTGDQTITLTGDVTGSGTGSFATTLAAVANAKLATMANNTIKSNISGGVTTPSDNTLTALLDTISSTQGAVLYRNASNWTSLTPGTSGQVLTSNGAGANPSYQTSTSSINWSFYPISIGLFWS